MNLDNTTKAKVLFGLNLLSGINVSGYKIKSVDMEKGEFIFTNGKEEQKLNRAELETDLNENGMISDTSVLNTEQRAEVPLSETSDNVPNGMVQNGIIPNKKQPLNEQNGMVQNGMVQNGMVQNGIIPNKKQPLNEQKDVSTTLDLDSLNSMTSENNEAQNSEVLNGEVLNGEVLNGEVQKGGNRKQNKNIFKSSKYSDTSSAVPSDMSKYSKYSNTSSVMFNGRSDKYSDTSVLGQIGGKNMQTSDTLMSVSELKERKSKSSSKLDVGIFKKIQNGGSKADPDIKRKMMAVGINSSSTSSICE